MYHHQKDIRNTTSEKTIGIKNNYVKLADKEIVSF
jgi:hypothetical protein